MWQSADSLSLTNEQKKQLEQWVQAPSTPHKIVLRRHHFLNGGVAGLEPEPARKTSSQRTQDEQIKAIVEATLQTQPKDATHWSSRTLADRLDRKSTRLNSSHLVISY